MISVCIPVYNYHAYPLVRSLSSEIEQLGAQDRFEIVCIDDHSSDECRNQNKGIENLAVCHFLDANIGRAQIRNLFLQKTKGEWLLFLDNDSVVPDRFLQNYEEAIGDKADVIVGGRIYDPGSDDRQHHLRYLYGTRVESRTVGKRRKNPYKSFMTNNFMVRRSVMENIQFDPRLANYGHEDTLFGYRLEEHRIPILHIDNPVVNGYVESNKEFLQKTNEGIESLVFIYNFMQDDPHFCQSVRLIDTYVKFRRLGLLKVVYNFFERNRESMELHFETGKGFSLRQFSLYKLGLFIEKNNGIGYAGVSPALIKETIQL